MDLEIGHDLDFQISKGLPAWKLSFTRFPKNRLTVRYSSPIYHLHLFEI